MNPLFHKMMDHIASIPIIDVHSHIDVQHPDTNNPKDIVFYEYILNELRSAGMPNDLSLTTTPADQLMPMAVSFFKMIRNTSTYWCLTRMLEELYDFHEDIDQHTWKTLFKKIESTSSRPHWYREVLGRKARIERTFATLTHDRPVPSYDSQFFVGALRVDSLIDVTRRDLEKLGKNLSRSIESLDELEDAIQVLLTKCKPSCAAITAYLPPAESLHKANRHRAKPILKELLAKPRLAQHKTILLRSYMLHRLLSLCEENSMPFQVLIGVRKPFPGAAPPDYAMSSFERGMISCFYPLLNRFKRVTFDFFLGCKIASHELTVLAKSYPNVHVTGNWWFTFYPSMIREFLMERLEIIPYTKIGGFFSDAHVVPWSFAKASMIRLQLARVLTHMVERGYYNEELANDIARGLLYDNPKRIYAL
jgi:glucuronate isomerase